MHIARFTNWLAAEAARRAPETAVVKTFADAEFPRSRYGVIIRTPSGGWVFAQIVCTGGGPDDVPVYGTGAPDVPRAVLPAGDHTPVHAVEAWLAWVIADADAGEISDVTRYSHDPGLGLHPRSCGVRVRCHSGRTLFVPFLYLVRPGDRVRPSALFAPAEAV